MNDDEKICPRCAETIKKAALVCRYCGHEFDPAEVKPTVAAVEPAAPAEGAAAAAGDDSDRWTARNIVLGGLGLIVAIALIGQCGSQTPSPTGADDNLDAAAANLDAAVEADLNAVDTIGEGADSSTGWEVSTRMDEVRGSPIHLASLTSLNEVDFDFPYGGGSRLMITIRRHPEYGEDVMFQISDGQFVCGIDDCYGMINIDGQAEQLTLSEPSDHDSKTLFATYGEGIIKRLKGSRKVVVELPFYQEGNRQFTFDTDGLVWPPKG